MQEPIFEAKRSLGLKGCALFIRRVFVVVGDIVVELWRRLDRTIGVFSVLKVLPVVISNFRLLLGRLRWCNDRTLLVVLKDALPCPFPAPAVLDFLYA